VKKSAKIAVMHVVVTNRDPGTSIVTVQGSLDLTTAPQLRATMDTLLCTGRIRIVVDLTGVDFCDSIGLGTFAYSHNHCAGNGGFLRLAGPSPFLARLLKTVGLTGPIPVYPTVAAALAASPGTVAPRPPRQTIREPFAAEPVTAADRVADEPLAGEALAGEALADGPLAADHCRGEPAGLHARTAPGDPLAADADHRADPVRERTRHTNPRCDSSPA
jgi:anti-sigma B factor antagonist